MADNLVKPPPPRTEPRLFEQLAVPARAVGGFVEMSIDTFVKIFRRPFQFREFLDQTWMIARVSLIPTLLVAIPFTVLVAFTLNILLREIGVVPRVLASTVVALLLNGLVCAIGLAGGYVFSVFLQGVNPGAFINGLTVLTGLGELVLAEVKALLFGVVAGLVGCYRGLTVQGGPKGVGTAVNETVVYAFICLFVINVIMTAVGVRVLVR